jgi:hypothetical protein
MKKITPAQFTTGDFRPNMLLDMTAVRATIQCLSLLAAGNFSVAFCQTNSVILITAPAKMESRGEWVHLRISDEKHTYDLPWAYPPYYNSTGAVSLETNHVYTFTVVEEESALIPKDLAVTNILIPRIRRIEDHGRVVWDQEVCEVHKVKMDFKEVPTVYGLIPPPGPSDPSPGQELRLFPHRSEVLPRGCAVRPEDPKTGRIYVCSACKEAFAWWSGTATVPFSVLPRDTRYDPNQHLRLVYLEAYGQGYVAAWARKEALPVFAPTTDDDKAKVFGYADGTAAGRSARDGWSAADGQRYGPTNSMLRTRNR